MGNGNKVEFLVAICALVASAMAVYMAWDQSRVMRAQQHGAVFPVLQVDGFVSNTPEVSSIGMRISNSGVGPALIENVALFHDGHQIDSFEAHRNLLPAGYDLSWAGLAGRALAPGEEITPISILWSREDISDETITATANDWGRFEIRICYCSVFRRCWRSQTLGTSRAIRVNQCKASETDVFEALGVGSADPEAANIEEAK